MQTGAPLTQRMTESRLAREGSRDGWDQGRTWAFTCVRRGSRGDRALSQFLWQGLGVGTVRACGLRQAPSWARAAVPGAGRPLQRAPPGDSCGWVREDGVWDRGVQKPRMPPGRGQSVTPLSMVMAAKAAASHAVSRSAGDWRGVLGGVGVPSAASRPGRAPAPAPGRGRTAAGRPLHGSLSALR